MRDHSKKTRHWPRDARKRRSYKSLDRKRTKSVRECLVMDRELQVKRKRQAKLRALARKVLLGWPICSMYEIRQLARAVIRNTP